MRAELQQTLRKQTQRRVLGMGGHRETKKDACAALVGGGLTVGVALRDEG